MTFPHAVLPGIFSVELNAEEAAEHEALRAAEGNREVREMAMTWADKKIAEGLEKGFELGRAEGFRELVLRQLGLRFGPLGEETRRRVEAISSPDALARLADQVLVARSLEEMGLA
jgi:flagellar biosynthesis/type III secretory pathway protein FliH